MKIFILLNYVFIILVKKYAKALPQAVDKNNKIRERSFLIKRYFF